ncbi:nuclear speckle splicing regulatory protein 1-like [Papaver somniferum]|uniref:nuclear speckle splicing regulatory protein 1-like n=1 Tax=Papaver somniferum TaxID=3469 RepID=UPI000E6FA8EF|nr:nuclear speckle splicing regulatory protein 1-like [Papaver somniferum]
MNSSGANQLEMDVDAPTRNPSGQHANNRTLRSAFVHTHQDERDEMETSLSSTASAARSQLREEDIANKGVRANQQPAQANNPPAAQVNNSRVTPIDLTLRERFQELERENKRLKVALEKRKELEEEAIPHSEINRSNRRAIRERYDPRRGDEVLNDRRLSQNDARRSEDVRNVYQSRDHHDDDYYDRYVQYDDHYYTAEQDRRTRSSRKKHRQRDDHINDDHSKRSRRDKDLSKRRKESDKNERIRRETEGDSVRGKNSTKEGLVK